MAMLVDTGGFDAGERRYYEKGILRLQNSDISYQNNF